MFELKAKPMPDYYNSLLYHSRHEQTTKGPVTKGNSVSSSFFAAVSRHISNGRAYHIEDHCLSTRTERVLAQTNASKTHAQPASSDSIPKPARYHVHSFTPKCTEEAPKRSRPSVPQLGAVQYNATTRVRRR